MVEVKPFKRLARLSHLPGVWVFSPGSPWCRPPPTAVGEAYLGNRGCQTHEHPHRRVQVDKWDTPPCPREEHGSPEIGADDGVLWAYGSRRDRQGPEPRKKDLGSSKERKETGFGTRRDLHFPGQKRGREGLKGRPRRQWSAGTQVRRVTFTQAGTPGRPPGEWGPDESEWTDNGQRLAGTRDDKQGSETCSLDGESSVGLGRGTSVSEDRTGQGGRGPGLYLGSWVVSVRSA